MPMQNTLEFEQASRTVTLRDIADHCGVSVMSVSRALRGDTGHLSEKTRDVILATAQTMGYDPSRHLAARRLVHHRTGQAVRNNVIGMFFPMEFDLYTYFTTIFRGVLSIMKQERYALLADYIHQPGVAPLAGVFTRGDVDGVIGLANKIDFAPLCDQLRREVMFHDKPVVSLLEPIEGCSSVLVDDFQGGYLLAFHFLEKGHRHLMHFCHPEGEYPLQQRYQGFCAAYRDRGLDPVEHLHFCMGELYADVSYIAQFIEKELAQYPEITGILARNDVTAIKIHDALCAMGRRVPEDISLAGYDDTDMLFDAAGRNMLTTIRVPLLEVGQAAARLIIHRVTGQTPADEIISLPVTLVERHSVIAIRE